MLLCSLLVYFTAGVFVGAPLSFVNKQLRGDGHQLAILRGTVWAPDNVSEQVQYAEVHQESVPGDTDQQATASIVVVLVETASSEPDITIVLPSKSDITIVVHPVEVSAPLLEPEAATSSSFNDLSVRCIELDSSEEVIPTLTSDGAARDTSSATLLAILHQDTNSPGRPLESPAAEELAPLPEVTSVSTTDHFLTNITVIPADTCPASVDNRSDASPPNVTLDDELFCFLSALPLTSTASIKPTTHHPYLPLRRIALSVIDPSSQLALHTVQYSRSAVSEASDSLAALYHLFFHWSLQHTVLAYILNLVLLFTLFGMRLVFGRTIGEVFGTSAGITDVKVDEAAQAALTRVALEGLPMDALLRAVREANQQNLEDMASLGLLGDDNDAVTAA